MFGGARAVGKSTLARRQLESHGYAYYTLADAGTLRQVSSDAAAWIQRIRVPAIVDESQLAKDIPLAVKEYTDQKPGQDILSILTGSASIARSGLGGQDPLTRRVRRFSLYPLARQSFIGLRSTSLIASGTQSLTLRMDLV